MSDRPFKYWNGYSWREHRPGFYGIDRSVASESLLESTAGHAPLTEETLRAARESLLGLTVATGQDWREPLTEKTSPTDPGECLDEDGKPTHPGEPCIVGGPRANHAW